MDVAKPKSGAPPTVIYLDVVNNDNIQQVRQILDYVLVFPRHCSVAAMDYCIM